MRITILTYVEDPKHPDIDVVVGQVAAALKARKHKVSVLPVHADWKKLIYGLKRRRPQLVFNLLEMFGDDLCGHMPVCGLLDILGYKYTGCGPGDFYLGQDKVIAKKLLAFEGILTPKFAVFSEDKGFETAGNLRMPMFVKPASMDSSIGIGRRSLVTDARALMERVNAIHRDIGDAALAEEYIEGREFYVGVLGNQNPVALPPVEADFSGLPHGQPHVLDQRAKFDESSAEYQGTRSEVASVSDELRARLNRVSLDAYRALRVKDYGRVDLRVTDAGEIYVLEVNASCYLEKEGEFAMAAKAAGIEYEELINRIVDLAKARYAVIAERWG